MREQIVYPSDTDLILEGANLIGDPTDIAGIHHYKEEALEFFHGAQACEKKDRFYACMLMPEPSNRFDKNAIAVWGVWTEKKWFKTKQRQEKIGYIPAEFAAEVAENAPPEAYLKAELDELKLSSSGFLDIWVQLYTN
jgi:hypothetical protein